MHIKTYHYQGIHLIRHHFQSITSTIIYAKELKHLGHNEWYLITADMQTHGIGKSNRSWVSPKSNLSATYSLKLKKIYLPLIPLLPFAAGLSVCQTVLQFCENVSFKWPNDVLIDKKKVSGILVEFFQDNNDKHYYRVLISVGLNVNASPEELSGINQSVTSLAISTNKTYRVDEVLEILSHRLIAHTLNLIEENKSPIHFLRPLLERFDNQKILLQRNSQYIAGYIIDITDLGCLEFQSDDGQMIYCSANEEIISFIRPQKD